MIRQADFIKDKDALIKGLNDFIQHINKDTLFPSDEQEEREQAFSELMQNPMVCTLVDEVNGSIVGGIGLIIVPYLWNPKYLVAEEIFWWCTRDAPSTSALRLIKAVKQHCKQNNVNILSMSKMYNSPSNIARVYNTLGLEEIQSSYIGFLKWQ